MAVHALSQSSRTLDPSRWAVVAYNDDTGLGRMAQDITTLFGMRQLVIPSNRLDTKPLREGGRDVVLAADLDQKSIESMLSDLQGIVILERWWHSALPLAARRLGIPVVCVPMWEWFRGTDKDWRDVDLFLCPTRFAFDIVRSYGWRNATQLTWAFDLSRFAARRIQGPGRLFFHNAGLIDGDDRKRTRDTIRAFRMIPRRDIRLIIRLQRPADVGPLDDRIEVRVGNVDLPELYGEGEVAVQPSSMEGIGFMVLEPVCCGIPTITLDYPPMSDYVTQAELRVRKRWFKRRAASNSLALVPHAHRRLPVVSDLARKIEWCASNDLEPISRSNRAFAETAFEPDRLRKAWQDTLEGLL